MKIKRNRLRCLKCKDIIESKYRHDFVSCRCGAIFVDGGHSYFQCGGQLELIEELYEFEENEETKPIDLDTTYSYFGLR